MCSCIIHSLNVIQVDSFDDFYYYIMLCGGVHDFTIIENDVESIACYAPASAFITMEEEHTINTYMK
jgi:hypothetical protein